MMFWHLKIKSHRADCDSVDGVNNDDDDCDNVDDKWRNVVA